MDGSNAHFHTILLKKASTVGVFYVDLLFLQDAPIYGQWAHLLRYVMVTECRHVSDMFIPPADSPVFHCCFIFILRPANMQISQELTSLKEVFFKSENCRSISCSFLLAHVHGEFILKKEKYVNTICWAEALDWSIVNKDQCESN